MFNWFVNIIILFYFSVKVSSHLGIFKTDELIDNEMQPHPTGFNLSQNPQKRKSTLKNFQPKLKEEFLFKTKYNFKTSISNQSSTDSSLALSVSISSSHENNLKINENENENQNGNGNGNENANYNDIEI